MSNTRMTTRRWSANIALHAFMFLVICQIVALSNQDAMAQGGDDETFRNFHNQPLMSPQELLQRLDRLPGVNVGTQENPLADEGFRDWVQEDLLPNLSDSEKEALARIAKDVMERQNQELQTDPNAFPSTRQEQFQQAADELRRMVERDPTLERRLRESAENLNGSDALNEFLDRPTNREGRNPQGTNPQGTNQGQGLGQNPLSPGGREGTQQNGNAGQGISENGTDPTQPNSGTQGQPNGNELNNPRGLGQGGSTQPPNLNGDPSRPPIEGPGSGLNPSDPNGTNSGSNGGGNPGAQQGNGNSLPGLGQNGNNGIGQGGSQRPGGQGNGSPNQLGSGRPRTGPNNPRNNNSPPPRDPRNESPQSEGNRSSNSQTDANGSNEQMRAPKNERFRDRFNRILMDAARDSVKPSGESEGGDGEDRSNALNGMLNGIAKSVQERMENRETRRAISDGFQRARNGGGPNPRFSNRNILPQNIPTEAPEVNSSGITLVVILIVIGVIAFFLTRTIRERMTTAVSRYASVIAHAKSFRLPQIQSSADLIRAVDSFVFWKFGQGSHWWHGGRVQKQLVASHPQLSGEIGELLTSYEQARYAPNSALDHQKIDRNANTLKHLVEIVRARELSQLNRPNRSEHESEVLLASAGEQHSDHSTGSDS